MPKASVVIPCYNAERFLEKTLATVRAQTMRDLEIVCVDDGSTDGTLELLRRLANDEPRMRVIAQPNGGEGPARDAGLVAATGEYLYFLDSDDFMEPTLLEEAIARIEQTGADFVIFRTRELDDQTGELRDMPWCFVTDWIGEDVFDPADHSERIFDSFQNWVHNKVYRASFVRAHDLHFQHVRRSADILFTCRALSEATRIALLDRPLHQYRVNNPGSALFTSDCGPLDFYEGFLALRASLEEHGTWELYHDSFVTWAQEGVAMNLQRTRSLEDFALIARVMREEGVERLDLLGVPRERARNFNCWDRCQAIATLPEEELLFHYLVWEKQESNRLETDLSRTRIELKERIADVDKVLYSLDCVMGSASFRIGRAITAVPRKLRDLLSRNGQRG